MPRFNQWEQQFRKLPSVIPGETHKKSTNTHPHLQKKQNNKNPPAFIIEEVADDKYYRTCNMIDGWHNDVFILTAFTEHHDLLITTVLTSWKEFTRTLYYIHPSIHPSYCHLFLVRVTRGAYVSGHCGEAGIHPVLLAHCRKTHHLCRHSYQGAI